LWSKDDAPTAEGGRAMSNAKDVTIIFTMEATVIGNMEDDDIKTFSKLANNPKFIQLIEEFGKLKLNADDVNFRIQVFEHSEGDSN
jgi:hypothetical protein